MPHTALGSCVYIRQTGRQDGPLCVCDRRQCRLIHLGQGGQSEEPVHCGGHHHTKRRVCVRSVRSARCGHGRARHGMAQHADAASLSSLSASSGRADPVTLRAEQQARAPMARREGRPAPWRPTSSLTEVLLSTVERQGLRRGAVLPLAMPGNVRGGSFCAPACNGNKMPY